MRPIKTTGAQPGEGRQHRPSPLLDPCILPLNGANPALRMGHMAHPSEPSTRTVKAGNPWAVTDRGGHDHEKKAFAILTLCISLFAAVALVGCGGSGGATGSGGGGGAEKPAVDMRTDFIWFKVEVPEGVEITDVAGDTADRAQFKFTESEHASDRFIPVFDSDKNADELFDYEAKWKANSGWTESDPVKYNGKTWRNAYFTHSGGVTTEYFTDVDGGSVYVRIDNVEEHKDAVETMMKSLEFADDIAEAKTEAMDVKLDDIEIKR